MLPANKAKGFVSKENWPYKRDGPFKWDVLYRDLASIEEKARRISDGSGQKVTSQCDQLQSVQIVTCVTNYKCVK